MRPRAPAPASPAGPGRPGGRPEGRPSRGLSSGSGSRRLRHLLLRRQALTPPGGRGRLRRGGAAGGRAGCHVVPLCPPSPLAHHPPLPTNAFMKRWKHDPSPGSPAHQGTTELGDRWQWWPLCPRRGVSDAIGTAPVRLGGAWSISALWVGHRCPLPALLHPHPRRPRPQDRTPRGSGLLDGRPARPALGRRGPAQALVLLGFPRLPPGQSAVDVGAQTGPQEKAHQ